MAAVVYMQTISIIIIKLATITRIRNVSICFGMNNKGVFIFDCLKPEMRKKLYSVG